MPVPGEGLQKKLSQIKNEIAGDGYIYTTPDQNTKLKAMEVDEEYGEVNQASPDKPDGNQPSDMGEWSNYDHSSTADVYGCMDETAVNYNPVATISDGSCTYQSGCMDPTACNFNAEATIPTDCVYAAQYYDCDGNCLNDSDGDGICNELEVAGCTVAAASSGTLNLAVALSIANGATDIIKVGNYNPAATNNNGSCEVTYIGCFNEQSYNYDSYSPLLDAISSGGPLNLGDSVEQSIQNDDSMCDFTPPQTWPEGEDPPWVNLKARRYESQSTYTDTPQFTSGDGVDGGWTTNQEIGLSSGIKLKEIIFSGGPGNNSSIFWNYWNSANFNYDHFIRRIMIYSQGYVDANGSNFGNSTWRATAEAANGAYQMYRFESANGYTQAFNNSFIDLYSMKMTHGGPIKLYILVGPFNSSCCNEDAPNYAASQQPQEGTHYNTNPGGAANYTNDDPYYFRKAILRWEVEDINFSEDCLNCYDPMQAIDGTDYPDDPYFQGCRDRFNLGDASNNNENHWECPESINEYLQEIRQSWDYNFVGYPPDEETGEAEEIVEPRRSDERWKQNIESVGVSPSGLPIYEWEYLEKLNMPGKYRGTIAQELIKCNRRDAIVKDSDGYYWVNYNKIDIKLEKKGYDKI